MPFFKKRQKSEKNTSSALKEPAPAAVLATGRLAPVFQRMYIWVLSANLNYNSYQIESGATEFYGTVLPMRGQYSSLLNTVAEFLLPDYVDRLMGTFSTASLSQTFRSGRTGVSDVFCMKQTENEVPISIQLRAERIPDSNPNNFAFLLFARKVQNEDDHGASFRENTPVETLKSGEIDWDAVRSRRYHDVFSHMQYEYHVASDCLYLHAKRDGETPVRPLERFLSTLESHSDYLISHDSIAAVRKLLKNGMSGQQGDAEIVFRTGGKRSAPFRHYRMTCLPLEETGSPAWLFGSMQDIESEYKHRTELEESANQVGTVLEKIFTNLYLIDTDKNTLRFLVKTNEGFRASENSYHFQNFFEQKIRDGTIAEESAEEYRRLIKPGYLNQRVGKKALSINVRLRKSGSEEYCWYEDLFCSVPGKPHHFILSRRDVSVLYEARQREFQMEESLHLMEHCEAMLFTMAGLVEFRNIETGSHIYHVRDLTQILLEDITRRSPQYNLTPQMIHMCVQAAAIHDIGKITVSDAILNKPARLSDEEYAIMQSHTIKGAQIIENLNLPGQEELKKMCYDVARHHHERWDGNGYPDRLAGDDISIYAQAVGLADVLDALVSKRCYKGSIGFETALDMIFNGQCGAFNPRILESLSHCIDAAQRLYFTTDEIEETKE